MLQFIKRADNQVPATRAGRVRFWVDLNGRPKYKDELGVIRDFTGPAGVAGERGDLGPRGFEGWEPVLAVVQDGERRVLQIADWVGGGGVKPASGQYLGLMGFVTDIAQATDLGLGFTPANADLIGAPNGIAELDGNGQVPASQLPSYVDDVLEFADFSMLPSTGESGKIYVDKATNKTYRWSGSMYVQITSGAVDSVNGKTGVVSLSTSDVPEGENLYFTEARAQALVEAHEASIDPHPQYLTQNEADARYAMAAASFGAV